MHVVLSGVLLVLSESLFASQGFGTLLWCQGLFRRVL